MAVDKVRGMTDAHKAMVQARIESRYESARLDVIQAVLADFFLLYQAAENEPVEEIRRALGDLSKKLQDARAGAIERKRIMDQLADDIQTRIESEA